ncbi:MAG: hypothetical protein Q9227_001172 [Pyrenula ochraceoflavens]
MVAIAGIGKFAAVITGALSSFSGHRGQHARDLAMSDYPLRIYPRFLGFHQMEYCDGDNFTGKCHTGIMEKKGGDCGPTQGIEMFSPMTSAKDDRLEPFNYAMGSILCT